MPAALDLNRFSPQHAPLLRAGFGAAIQAARTALASLDCRAASAARNDGACTSSEAHSGWHLQEACRTV